MPYLTDDWDPSELYLSQGSGEILLDTGEYDEVASYIRNRVDTANKLIEFSKGLKDKADRDAREVARRKAQPPPPVVDLKPVMNLTDTTPQESPPIAGDAPELQGAPDLATLPENIVILETRGQSFAPPVSLEEPSHTAYDQFNPLDPVDVASLLVPPPGSPPDFDALIDRLRKNLPENGQPHPTLSLPAARTPAAAADPVDLFSGAFTIRVVDMVVPTPFIPIAMARSYRSGRTHFGPFGHGWDHDYNVFLRPLKSGAIALWTGELREQQFRANGAGFETPPGYVGRLEQAPGPDEIYTLHLREGSHWEFRRPSGWSDPQRIPLVAIVDRHGNRITLTYDAKDLLASVLDEARRGLFFSYGTCELLEAVTDHTGTRTVRYDHDTEVEHLVRVALPGTAQYPDGLVTVYEYDSYAGHPAMQHNILRIFDTAGRLTVENDYAGPDDGWEFNCVVAQRVAGFEYQFGYEQIQYVTPDPANVEALAARTLVRTPDGALHTYTFNYRGDLLDHRFRLGLDGSFRVVASQYAYDSEGNLTNSVEPDGLATIYAFDTANPDPCARRNLLRVERVSPLPGIVPSRILTRTEYDARFQLPIRVRDETGVETRFIYDFDTSPIGASGRLIRIELPVTIDADGVAQHGTRLFEHNTRGQLTAAIKPEGGREELEYLSGGPRDGFLAVVTQDPAGQRLQTTFDYDAAGFPDSVESPGGRTFTFTHNVQGQVEVAAVPEIGGLNGIVRTWYDDSGAVVRRERPAGSCAPDLVVGDAIVDIFERDEVGHLRKATLAANSQSPRAWMQSVDHEGRSVSTWDALGMRTDRQFDERGALLSETSAAGDTLALTSHRSYDHAGRLTQVIGAQQDITTFEYDVWGRLHRLSLPGGAIQIFVWGVDDRLLEERVEEPSPGGADPARLLKRQSYDYDERGRVLATKVAAFADDPVSATLLETRYLYDKDDNLLARQLPRGAEYHYAFDALGRTDKMTDPHGNVSHLVYDAAGNVAQFIRTEVEGGIALTTTMTQNYDARGRLTRSECLGSVAQYGYDDRDLVTDLSRSDGKSTRLAIDALGQIIERTDDPAGLALATRFEYDANGNLAREIDAMGTATRWERDLLGRATAMDPPDGMRWETIIDFAARKTELRTPAGNRTILEYASGGARPIAMSCLAAPGQEPVVSHRFVYDGLGRLARAEAGVDVIERRYDSLDRVVEETTRGKTVKAEYDDAAGTSDLVFPDGRRERTEYNPRGRPVRITLVTPGDLGGLSGETLLELHYSTAGRLTGQTYANGVVGNLAHDVLGRTIRVDYERAGVQLDSCRVRFDDNGHRAVVQYLGTPANNLLHSFDACGRLTEWRADFALSPLADISDPVAQAGEVAAIALSAPASPGTAFTLDGSDARVKSTELNGGPPGEVYATGPDHRTIAEGSDLITYNADAHRTIDRDYIYELDALDRVRRVLDRSTSAVVAELNYDPLSRAASGVAKGQAFERWFAASTKIHEVVGGPVRQHSPHPLWTVPFHAIDEAGDSYIHEDQGWSTMCVTDATGNVRERHRYDVFGANRAFGPDGTTILASGGTETSWRGMAPLGGTRLFHTPYRLYDPRCGVFTSRDPMLYADSPSPYAFAGHNPVDFADPLGLSKSPISDAPTYLLKETVIYPEEMRLSAAQNTPPPIPDHHLGFYPLKDTDRWLSERYGSYWGSIKSAINFTPLVFTSVSLGLVEDLNPYNAPDHFFAAGSHANRWIWYSRRGQSGTGLVELLQGHLEASSAVGSAEVTGALGKGVATLGSAAIAKAGAASTRPTAYSVALEVKLTPGDVPSWVDARARRKLHRQFGEAQVFELVNFWNRSLNPEERELGKQMNELIKNSNDWHLHHVPEQPGVLQLVYAEQHQSAVFQDLFHPIYIDSFGGKIRTRRRGGFSRWGVRY